MSATFHSSLPLTPPTVHCRQVRCNSRRCRLWGPCTCRRSCCLASPPPCLFDPNRFRNKTLCSPAEDSSVRFGGFWIGFETTFENHNPVKIDEICPISFQANSTDVPIPVPVRRTRAAPASARSTWLRTSASALRCPAGGQTACPTCIWRSVCCPCRLCPI